MGRGGEREDGRGDHNCYTPTRRSCFRSQGRCDVVLGTPAPTPGATETTPKPTDAATPPSTEVATPEATPLETMEAATPSPTAVATPAPTPPETTTPAATPPPETPAASASTTPDPSPPSDTPAPAADQCDPNGTGATGCCPGTPQYDVCECWGCLEPSGECQYAVLVGTQAREGVNGSGWGAGGRARRPQLWHAHPPPLLALAGSVRRCAGDAHPDAWGHRDDTQAYGCCHAALDGGGHA